jgi:hypothetical protein
MSPRDLYFALFSYFNKMSLTEVEILASRLTRAIEYALAKRQKGIDTTDFPADLAVIVAKISISPASLSIPWQACRALQFGEPDHWAHTPLLDTILATGPAEYGDVASVPWSKMQPHSRSLVLYVSNLIFTAKNRLLVVSPYWSAEGISNLKLARDVKQKPPAEIIVMTSANPSSPNRRGLSEFASWMRAEGANVKILVPKPLSDGTDPMVHAKVILADGERGYLGSANISENGLQRSIEAGVGLRGPAVFHLEKWYHNMWPYFDELLI